MHLKDTNANFGAFVAKRVRYEGSSLRSRDEAYQGKLRDHLVEHALPMFVSGKLKSVIEKVFPWDQIQEVSECRLVRWNGTDRKTGTQEDGGERYDGKAYLHYPIMGPLDGVNYVVYNAVLAKSNPNTWE